MPRALAPDHGELLSFEVRPDGGVLLSVSDCEDDYAHSVLITPSEMAGMAGASAEAHRTRTVACERCHLDRPAFELNNCGICVVCVAGR